MEPRGLGQSHAESEATGADWMNNPTTEYVAEELTFREALLPPQLQELRQKLSQKAKQQKRFRFYSLLRGQFLIMANLRQSCLDRGLCSRLRLFLFPSRCPPRS